MFRRALNKIIDYGLSAKFEDPSTRLTHVESDHILRHLPQAMLVHPIKNGYILRVEDYQHNPGDFHTVTVVYAKDEIGIAEQIIAHQARDKMGVPAQGELFGTTAPGSDLSKALAHRKSAGTGTRASK